MTAIQHVGPASGALALSGFTSTVTPKNLIWFDTETGKDSEDNLGAGELMAKFARETDEVRMATSLACGMVIQYLTTTIVCLALGFTRS